MENPKNYFNLLNERAKKSRVYRKYQMIGLMIAQILDDEKHKSLYIKLAKIHPNDDLLAIAKDVADRKNIEYKGAYFMRIISKTHPNLLKRSSS